MKYYGEENDIDFNPGNTIQNGTADGLQVIQVPRTPHAHLDHFSENLPLPLTQSSHLDLDSIASFPSLRDPNDLPLHNYLFVEAGTEMWEQERPGPGFRVCHSLAVQLLISYFTSLGLSFHIWKMGGLLPTQGIVWRMTRQMMAINRHSTVSDTEWTMDTVKFPSLPLY